MEGQYKIIADKLWQSKTFNRIIDICRILAVILIIALIIYIVKEIEAVKLLAYDACKICTAKTGCSCFCMILPP